MHCFFDAAQVKKATELAAYGLYFVTVWLVSSQYSRPFIYFAANMVFVFLLAQIYPGKQGKKLVAAFLLQGNEHTL